MPKSEKLLAFIFVMVLMLIEETGFAQEYSENIQPASFRANNIPLVGHSVVVHQGQEEVDKFLFQYLKSIGRPRKKSSFFLTQNISDLESSGKEIILFARSKPRNENTRVSFGLDTVGLGKKNYEKLDRELKNLIIDFNKRIFLQQLQDKLSEAEQAAVIKSKEYQKLVNEYAALEKELAFNEEERLRLEKALGENAQEKVDLIESQQLNEKRRGLTQEELDKIKSRLETLKQELAAFEQQH